MMAEFDLRNLNIYLIGMMGSGKTTTGKRLAQALNYQFLDTDALIVQAAGLTIPEIFAEAGEAEFRKLETQVLSELSAYTRLVIATGGGIVLERLNWSHLQQGLVIWLNADVTTLLGRLEGDRTRPLLQDSPALVLEALLAQRRSLYAQADLTVQVEPRASPELVVETLLAEIPKVLLPQRAAPE